METFAGRERHDEYMAWLAAHPNAFVLHFNKPKGDVVLHRADCPDISVLRKPARFFTSYQKICSGSRSDLKAVAASHQDPTDCPHCRP
jgi:hypothetical protein